MSVIQEKNYSLVKSYIERQSWTVEETNEGATKRLDCRHGKYECNVKVYTNGSIQVQGKDSKLKECLLKAKDAIENEEPLGELLPFEIERFPELLAERIPEIDPVIVRFVREAIVCLKANSLLGCAFLLGGASEKAILLLIEKYTHAIDDPEQRGKFISRVSGKFIAKSFDEFKRSYKSSKNKPEGFGWSNDLETKIEGIFHFCRICRNETGHPHLPPNLDKGVLLANMGQFVKYAEDLYALIRYYDTNRVKL